MADTNIYDDKELFRLIGAGDEAAYRQFYDRHWNRIYSTALAYLKSTTQAEDAVQEVFLKLWVKREQLAGVGKPEAYIYIMCRNHVINALHRKIELSELNDDRQDSLPDDLLLPSEAIDLKQLQEKIRIAVDQLPPQQKNIFQLTREEGLGHEEIARKLGIEKTTVKNHMVRALNTLRKLLGENEYLILLSILTQQLIKN